MHVEPLCSTATRKFPEIIREIIKDTPSSSPMLAAHDALPAQIKMYEEQLKDIAKNDANSRRIMTMTGVSYLVALGFMFAIDDQTRFSSSNKVGPSLGLAARVRQSGNSSWCAGVGHSPSPMVRSYMYQAVTVMLAKTKGWSRLKAWDLRLIKRIGFKRAAIAVARKMAIIMHAIWVDGTEFEYGSAKPA